MRQLRRLRASASDLTRTVYKDSNTDFTFSDPVYEDGLCLIEADIEYGTETVHEFAYFYRNDKGFRIIEFTVFENSAEKYRDDVSEWAKSVTF